MPNIITARTGLPRLPSSVDFNPDSFVGQHRPAVWWPLRQEQWSRNVIDGQKFWTLSSAGGEAFQTNVGGSKYGYPFAAFASSITPSRYLTGDATYAAAVGNHVFGKQPNPWSMAFCLRRNSVGSDDDRPIGNALDGSNSWPTFRMRSTTSWEWFVGSGGFYVNAQRYLITPVNEWEWFLVGYDGSSQMKGWRDGVAIDWTGGTTTANRAPSDTNDGPYDVGRSVPPSAQSWDGQLAEVFLFDRTPPTEALANELYQPDTRWNHYRQAMPTFSIPAAAPPAVANPIVMII